MLVMAIVAALAGCSPPNNLPPAAASAVSSLPPTFPTDSSLNLAGNYTLLVEADPVACTDFPANLRSRTYQATISGGQPSRDRPVTFFVASLGGGDFDDYYHVVVLEVAGDQVTFDLSDNYVLEEIAPETYFAIGGVGGTQVMPGAASISASFNGSLDYCVTRSDKGGAYPCMGDMVTHARCDSRNHRLTLTRR
jgi:hypothetical protein